MEVSDFEDIQAEFMKRISGMVYCSMATIDSQDRPRSRVMHPVWDGPIGWAISWPASPKSKHLERNPHVSLAYVCTALTPVYIDGVAEWVDSVDEKLRIWDLCKTTPPPLGFDPETHYGSIHHHYYGLLRFKPRRIELASLNEEPIIWRPKDGSERG